MKAQYCYVRMLNTPLNLCSVCGGLGLACLDKIHVRHAFRGCVKSDNTLDSRITTLEPAVLAPLYIENLMCYPTLDKLRLRHLFRGCVKSDYTFGFVITTLEPAVLA